jgi:UDP-glucose 4-epimerase
VTTVAVTGAAGFIGRRLVERLCNAGYDVCAIVRSGGRRPRHERLTMVEWDLARESAPKGELPKTNAVVHLAAHIPAGPRGDESNFSENFTMTANLMRHLVCPTRVVFGSTIDVYGRPLTFPIREDHPTEPLTLYALSKLRCEYYLRETAAAQGFVLTVLRFAQVYGPGDSTGKAIPRFIHAILDGQAPTVRGDGTDLRDYVYVDDVTAAIALAVESRQGGVFNISAGQPHSIAEVLQILLQIHGASVAPLYAERQGEKYDFWFDISQARANLGYTPATPLRVGLYEQYRWARARNRCHSELRHSRV